jgi:uncharacterized protein (TIGR00369 family)
VKSVQDFRQPDPYRDTMTAAPRTGPFWDGVEGRAPVPPAAQTLGFEFIAADVEAGTIEVAFRAGHEFTTPFGDVLGGFVAAMLYDTVGPAVLATLGPGQFITTLEQATHFLRPAQPGRLVGRGRIVHHGDDVVVVDATLADGTASPVATATATLRVVNIEEVAG